MWSLVKTAVCKLNVIRVELLSRFLSFKCFLSCSDSFSHICVFMCEARVIPVYKSSSELLSAVMEETGGLGVDIVVDSGGKKIKLLFLTSSPSSLDT